MLVVLAAMTVAGFAATLRTRSRRAAEPHAPPDRDGAAGRASALVPVAAFAAVAASSRGLTGEVSHLWHSLTNSNGVVTESPGRLAELSNSRPRYWSEGLKVGEPRAAGGHRRGRLSRPRARTTRSDTLVAGHAHSYVIETFADFGLIGTLLSLALFVAWVIAAGRTLGGVGVACARHRTRRSRPSGPGWSRCSRW